MRIETPFSDIEVERLNAWQKNPKVHPFTCGGTRADPGHVEYAKRHRQRDLGLLVAEPDGWHCPVCGYHQTWAHDFMVLTIPKAKRGFAAMNPEKRREVAAKGGGSVPNEKRSFSRDRALAISAGAKGGAASRSTKKGKRSD